MSNINEILFHSLQRFDKKDADDLQKHLYDYLKDNLVSGTLGNVSGKIDTQNVQLTYNSGLDRYTLDASFDYLSGDGKFCTAEAGLTFDASGVRLYFQNTLSADGDLDDAEIWYLWARPETSEEANESREFFSPIDNAAVSQNVNTRKVTRSVIAAGRKKPDSTIGWARVATFDFEVLRINNVNTLAAPTMTPVNITDYMSFGLQKLKTAGTAGIQVITYAIEEAMRKMLSDGVEDPEGTVLTQPGSQPTMSIEGLTQYVKGQVYSKRGHIVLSFTPNPQWPAGTLVDFSDLTNIAPYQVPTVTDLYRLQGFAAAVVPHAYDAARFIIPFDTTEYSDLLNNRGIGANQMQDVNMFFTLTHRDDVDNVNDLFNQSDVTFLFGRSDAMIPNRWITMFGNNGPWTSVQDITYATTVGGVNYNGSQGIGLYTPLTRGRVDTSTQITRNSPNHDDIVKSFIDYHLTTGTQAGGDLVTDVAKYATPPSFEVHIIVKG